MNPKIADILSRNGWSPSRRVDAEPILSRMRALGYETTQILQDLLCNLLELQVVDERKWLSFAPVDIMRDADESVEYVRAIAGEGIAPIALGGGLLFYLSTSDRILVIDDAWISYSWVGSSSSWLGTYFLNNPPFKGEWITLTKEEVPPDWRDD